MGAQNVSQLDELLNRDDRGRVKRRPLPWPNGRLARLPYIGKVIGLALSCVLAFSILAALVVWLTTPAIGLPILKALKFGLFWCVLPAGMLFWSIERAHDANMPSWVGFLVFIPFVNLLFWFWPGQAVENRYGPPNLPLSRARATVIIAVVSIIAFVGLASRLYGPILPKKPVKTVPGLAVYPD